MAGNGGIIGPINTPTATVASGVWSMAEVQMYQGTSGLLVADPYWDSVGLLMNMNGSDASTTFTDSSATGRTFTAYGNAQIDTAQYKFGDASGLFDGTGDYITTPNSADFQFGSGDFTIEAWVRLNAIGQWHEIANQMTNSARGWMYDVTTGNKLRLYGFISSWQELGISTTSLTTGQWYHCAVTREGTSFRLFLDGVLEDTTVVSGAFTEETTNTLTIGLESANTRYMNGWIDDLRITKGVARYTATFTPPTAQLASTEGEVTWPTPPVLFSMLAVAGGGSGGGMNYHAGGGGAGGMLTATEIAVAPSVTLTVTIGAGGAAPSTSTQGNAGANSVISGTGMTTATATGGGPGARGYGNSGAASTRNGGSGGGGGGNSGASMTAESYTGGSGTQAAPDGNWTAYGSDGGDNIYGASTSPYGSGGGGGAGAAGGDTNGAGNALPGAGGAGQASAITGSSVNYAGGGGGSDAGVGSGGVGGSGGGGQGEGGQGAAINGTANLGGGGGGNERDGNTGAGGSGVVILRLLTASYSGTTTGSPTVTTDGSYTVVKFTGSGTIVA